MKFSKPDELGDIANLGLTLLEIKQVLARVQHKISIAQAGEHAVQRPPGAGRSGFAGFPRASIAVLSREICPTRRFA